jgi:hypothetical protein
MVGNEKFICANFQPSTSRTTTAVKRSAQNKFFAAAQFVYCVRSAAQNMKQFLLCAEISVINQIFDELQVRGIIFLADHLCHRGRYSDPANIAAAMDGDSIQIETQVAPPFPISSYQFAGRGAVHVPFVHARPDAIRADDFRVGGEELHEVIYLSQVTAGVTILKSLQEGTDLRL